MPVIGKRADHGETIRERHAVHGADHEADPAPHRIGRMDTQTVNGGGAKLVQDQAGRQSHAAGNAGRRLPLKRQGGILADIGQGGAEQGREIHTKTFGERRGFDSCRR